MDNTEIVELKIPETVVRYIDCNILNPTTINAMLVYPLIHNGTISHGRAAEILGVNKIDLIELYCEMGIPYLDQSKEELEEDISTLRTVLGGCR